MLLPFTDLYKERGHRIIGREVSPNTHTPNQQRPRKSRRFTHCFLECSKIWRFSLPKNNSKRYKNHSTIQMY